MTYEIAGADMFIASMLVLWLGKKINEQISFLSKNNIPIPVTGGLVISICTALLLNIFEIEVQFDMRVRDLLLLIFFSTIGLGAKLKLLVAGGKTLIKLIILAITFLVIQDVTGILLSMAFGNHPGYGLFAGSISFAGGHGTAIAWGEEAKAAGLKGADVIGIAFATFGLIAGGLIGGPLSGRLIKRYQLKPADVKDPAVENNTENAPQNEGTNQGPLVRMEDVFGTIMALAICVSLGDVVNRFLFENGVLLPGFLTAMVIGIALTNLSGILKLPPINKHAIDTCSDVSLNLFLAMSLMSMNLTSLGTAFGPIVVALFIQILVITLFTFTIVFRIMGKDYDAAVISGGFVGLGLGATPVAIANMHTITSKFWPSPKAFIVIPLVGAFFIDLINAIVIKFFLSLPIMQVAS